VGALIGLEFLLFELVDVGALTQAMLGSGIFSWLIVLAAFMGASMLAHHMAERATAKPIQYAGLGLYILAQTIILAPMLYLASRQGDQIILTAALTTVAMFGGISAFAFITGKDFSFLGGILSVALIGAIGLMVLSMIFGFGLGLIFVVAMIGIASGFVLYETSNVLHKYQTNQEVAASLALFASVALLFWYVLQLYLMMNE